MKLKLCQGTTGTASQTDRSERAIQVADRISFGPNRGSLDAQAHAESHELHGSRHPGTGRDKDAPITSPRSMVCEVACRLVASGVSLHHGFRISTTDPSII
jgi:hypothetical protein